MTEIVELSPRIRIDGALHGVWRGRRFYPLPARTWAILAYLVQHPNAIVSEGQLLAVVWPGELRTSADLVRHIHRIRQVLELQPRRPKWLVTYRGVGYCLRVPAARSSSVS